MSWVNKYIEIPYVDRGRSFEGADCWGLVYLVLLHEFGVEVPTYTKDYISSRRQYSGQIEELIHAERQRYIEIPEGQERPGDIINLRVWGKEWHTGIMTGKRHMLHTMLGHYSAHERYTGIRWENRIAGFYRHEQLAR